GHSDVIVGKFDFFGTNAASQNENLPQNFSLSQNFPNPFNPETQINYELKISGKANLLIFNLLGEKIREFELVKNKGFVTWNGTDETGKQVSSGIYFYKLKSENFSETKKMVLLK
ncbi:T9SS type A sorting domain-containing protein, partial [bacterium]|nr:T9SS type A sorting domain-containing protein [bacterium]